MTRPLPSQGQSLATDPILDDLLAEFANQLQAGTGVDLEAFIQEHPERAEVLRRLLPAIQVLADLEHSTGASEPSPAAFGPDSQTALGELGDFRILREIGRGGMGVVYEAEQISLGRRVALKVLPFAAALDAKQLQRFKNEAQAAAHLRHPHIVPVYSVGTERGVHFYAMQFIEGQTLAALIRDLRRRAGRDALDGDGMENAASAPAHSPALGRAAPAQSGSGRWPATGADTFPPPHSPAIPPNTAAVAAVSTERSMTNPAFFRTLANLGVQAAEALEHAHSLGVIHRDIKPANLLVDEDGDLWVTDFGLARLGDTAGLTLTGDLLGTIRYMGPEQALAKRGPVDPRADVYSLGATLYELLTLEPAYNGRDRQEILRQIAFEEPRPPRRLDPAIPTELETIVLKAMDKTPEERYATAQELADDLRRYLEDRPIRARRATLRQRVTKWSRRHKTVVRAAGVVVALAVIASAVSTALVWRANEDLNRTLERERQNGYFQRIALAEREWSANGLGRMQELLDECPQDLRDWEWHYLKRLRFRTVSPIHLASAVICAAFSPDGGRIASGDLDGFITIFDAHNHRELARFRAHESHVRGVSFRSDCRRLVSGSLDGLVKVWDAETGRLIHTVKGHRGQVLSVVFSPDGRRIASGGGQGDEFGEVNIWDAASGVNLVPLSGHTATVRHLAFSPDGRRLASASADTTVRIWDALTGEKLTTLRGHTQQVWKVAFSPDGRRLASVSGQMRIKDAGEIKIWDVPTGREMLTVRGHVGAVLSVAFGPDGRRLASGGVDQCVKLWDLATGREILSLRGHLGRCISTIAFSPDGNRLLSGCDDRTLRFWDATPWAAEAGEELSTLRGHRGGVRGVAFHPHGRLVASIGDDATVKIWDTQTWQALQTLPGHTGMSVRLAFDSQGKRLVLGGKRLRIWDATTWKELLDSPILSNAVALSPDDRSLAGVGGKNALTVKVHDYETLREIHSFGGHQWGIFCLAFHPDGRLASGSADSTVRLWDLKKGKEIAGPPLRHAGSVIGVAFSPDGQRLASASSDHTVKIWDTATWGEQYTFRNTSGVQSVAWSPDGQRLAWGGGDAIVKVWEAATGEIHTFRGHTSWVESVAFSDDGKLIASGSLDGTVKIWPTPARQKLPAPGTTIPTS